jgi:hypothetical protein
MHRQASGGLKKLWLKRMAPRPKHVDAFTRRNDLLRNPQTPSSIGEVQNADLSILAQAGESSNQSRLLAGTGARLTMAVATAWLAAGYSPILS